MRARSTVQAPANIAFIKYWGTTAPERALPANPSISMTLRECVSRCTVELRDGGEDEILLVDDEGPHVPPPAFSDRIQAHLDRLREWAGREVRFRVGTQNSFPAGAGLASSASGFAALTLAVLRVLDLDPGPAQRSALARRSGSGSAARSVFGGFVRWPVADAGPAIAPAAPIAGPDHWPLRDIIAVVETEPKAVSSLEGHQRAPGSPHYARRQTLLPERLEVVGTAIRERSLDRLGPVLEEEAVELHLIAMSSRPPIFYWRPATLAVLEAVRGLREDGVAAYFTMDAGANVHVVCEPAEAAAVVERLAALPGVRRVIRDGVGPGPIELDTHLI